MILASPPIRRPSIADLKERHHEIKRRLIAGEKQVEIAKSLGMTQAWLSIVISSPQFQAELIKLREEADKNAADIGGRIKKLAPDAMTVLERAVRGILRPDGSCTPIEGITETVRAKLALESLALAGHTKPQGASPAQANVRVEIKQFVMPGVVPAQQVVIEAQKEAGA